MAMSLPQGQCPIHCRLCQRDPKVKWKCLDCDLLMCSNCKDNVHSKFKSEKDHTIINIKDVDQPDKQTAGINSSPTIVKLINLKEYQTKLENILFLAVSFNSSLWIGDGEEKKGFRPFESHTALQNVKLVGDKAKTISSFKINVLDIAVTPYNDILMAIGEPRLKQIEAGSSKVTDSIYCTQISKLLSVHVTKDGRVIVGGKKFVIVMDSDGNHLTKYKKDINNKHIFDGTIWFITSTLNGNIFVVQNISNHSVDVLGKANIINKYSGHPSLEEFDAMSVVTTPMDNVIVADQDNHTLHILDNTGNLLNTYNTKDIGIEYPGSLAITMEGPFAVIYIGCSTNEEISETAKLYKMNIMGC